ncbi:MAG: hypothetical protein ACK418_19825 [Pseudomonas sp.]
MELDAGRQPRGRDGSNPWDKREQAKAAAMERAEAAKGKGGKPVVPR